MKRRQMLQLGSVVSVTGIAGCLDPVYDAVSGAPEETPDPGPTDDLEVHGDRIEEPYPNQSVIKGSVANNTGKTVERVEIRADLFDADDDLVEAFATDVSETLADGESADFRINLARYTGSSYEIWACVDRCEIEN